MRLLVAICAMGCSGCLVEPDYRSPPRLLDAGSDGEADVWTGTTPIFGACSFDRECVLAVGVVCLTTFPGGLCTHRCENAGDCDGSLAVCVDHVCLPRCHTEECDRHGGACMRMSKDFCAPACRSVDRTPPDVPTCVAGTSCDEWSNACFAPGDAHGGADNGAPCHDDLDCRGELCFTESDGYPEGCCASLGVTKDLVAGKPLPRSTCPAGSVVTPSILHAFGEFSLCLPECTTDASCRTGYFCNRFGGYATGACAPIDCGTGMPCPAGTRCDIDVSSGSGKCVK